MTKKLEYYRSVVKARGGDLALDSACHEIERLTAENKRLDGLLKDIENCSFHAEAKVIARRRTVSTQREPRDKYAGQPEHAAPGFKPK